MIKVDSNSIYFKGNKVVCFLEITKLLRAMLKNGLISEEELAESIRLAKMTDEEEAKEFVEDVVKHSDLFSHMLNDEGFRDFQRREAEFSRESKKTNDNLDELDNIIDFLRGEE